MWRLAFSPNDWSPELRAVLVAIAGALDGRSPTPELIAALSPVFEHSVAGHVATIEYFPEGYTDDPLLLPEYAVSLEGDRVKASWLLLETDFLAFLRQSGSN